MSLRTVSHNLLTTATPVTCPTSCCTITQNQQNFTFHTQFPWRKSKLTEAREKCHATKRSITNTYAQLMAFACNIRFVVRHNYVCILKTSDSASRIPTEWQVRAFSEYGGWLAGWQLYERGYRQGQFSSRRPVQLCSLSCLLLNG